MAHRFTYENQMCIYIQLSVNIKLVAEQQITIYTKLCEIKSIKSHH